MLPVQLLLLQEAKAASDAVIKAVSGCVTNRSLMKINCAKCPFLGFFVRGHSQTQFII